MATFGDFRDSGTSVFITDIVMLGKLILRSTKKVILAYTTFDTKKLSNLLAYRTERDRLLSSSQITNPNFRRLHQLNEDNYFIANFGLRPQRVISGIQIRV